MIRQLIAMVAAFGLMALSPIQAADGPGRNETETKRIEGQVFITTKGQSVYKLSSVKVRFVDSKKFQAVLDEFLEGRKAVERAEEYRTRATALVKAMPKMSPPDAAKARETLATLCSLTISNQPDASKATATGSMRDRIMVQDWRVSGSAAIVAMHNHPSGEPGPSEADIKVTRDLFRAGQLLKIELLDHVIVGRGRHISLRELGYFR